MHVQEESIHFKNDILNGLKNERQKRIPSKYLYDTTGSQLFEMITEQPEYYPTRTEKKLLELHSPDILKGTDKEIILIELGSGSSKKTKYLFDEILKRQKKLNYFPIDISFNFLNTVVSGLANSNDRIIVKGIADDYINGIKHCNNILFENNFNFNNISRLYVFFGSSIGNFELEEARNFLKSIRMNISNNDYFLIGFDMDKDKSIIEPAYNDKAGITSKFNLNLLYRINRELAANFKLENFSHYSYYNPDMRRVEMHIRSNVNQEVDISEIKQSFHFDKNETIHTENSYKYNKEEIEKLVHRVGFSIEKEFLDKEYWFSLVLLRPI